MLVMSILLIGLALVRYIGVDLAPMPAEGLVGCIAGKVKKPFSTMKPLFDCTSVLVGTVLSLVFLGKLVGIRDSAVLLNRVIPGSSMEILTGLHHGDLRINRPERYAKILTDWIGE